MKLNVKEIFLRKDILSFSMIFVLVLLCGMVVLVKTKSTKQIITKNHIHKAQKQIKVSAVKKEIKRSKAYTQYLLKKEQFMQIKNEVRPVYKKTFAKKFKKMQQRSIASKSSGEARSWEHLGRDSWGNSHEQVETLRDASGPDVASLEDNEDKKLSKEISASDF